MARSLFRVLTLLLLACTTLATPFHEKRTSWPYKPFRTDGRYMKNSRGQDVTYAGVNWPGAADVMIPEGLQYQSVSTIVSKIKELGMNVIRLTYPIELIDQIYENHGKDVPVKKALTDALGTTNGTKVFKEILAKNPTFNPSTTRLEVFDAIANECARQGIMVHLDNHVSKAIWCCSETDGNAWWGDTYFSISNWTRGLAYMANHGRSWDNLVSMSLRNEPRTPSDNTTLADDYYNWEYWYKYVQLGVKAINDANPDVLVFLSGLSYDTYLTPVVQGTALTPGTATFDRSDFGRAADLLVLELHNYANSASSCSSLESSLYSDGFEALTTAAVNVFPVVLTEWGFAMDNTTWEEVYTQCITSYLEQQKAGWMLWVLAGSYYIRSGTQDYDETWGLLTHDWSSWRSEIYVKDSLLGLVKNTASP